MTKARKQELSETKEAAVPVPAVAAPVKEPRALAPAPTAAGEQRFSDSPDLLAMLTGRKKKSST